MTDQSWAGGCGVPRTAGGVVATSLNLRTGARYEVTLLGSQRWVRPARVLSVLPDVVILQLDDGQRLTVPRTAVVSARPLGQAPPAKDQAPARASTRAGTAAASPPVSAETFYFTNINEKGSDVSAAWLLDLRTRLLMEPNTGKTSTQLKGSIADALDAVARQLLENEYERRVSAWEQASQSIAVATEALDSANSTAQKPPLYFRYLLRQLTYVVDTEHSRYIRSAVSSP